MAFPRSCTRNLWFVVEENQGDANSGIEVEVPDEVNELQSKLATVEGIAYVRRFMGTIRPKRAKINVFTRPMAIVT